jgi:prepilin-type N-terminal cleavage/methylation domain-containing protein
MDSSSCSCHRPGLANQGERAFSLVEIMVVIGVISVLVAVLIPSITNVIPAAQEATSGVNLEELNQAVLRFNQANWELVLDATGGSDDEISIVRSLQYRAAVNPSAGSPYLEPTLSVVSSDSAETYRASWNGRVFKVLSPGMEGTGLDLAGMHAGGTRASFALNYQPVGAP